MDAEAALQFGAYTSCIVAFVCIAGFARAEWKHTNLRISAIMKVMEREEKEKETELHL